MDTAELPEHGVLKKYSDRRQSVFAAHLNYFEHWVRKKIVSKIGEN